MGRTFYSTARPELKDLPKLVHVFNTPKGSLVLAMRPPEQGERGYAIGYDDTVLELVDEILGDWLDTDPGPGWVATSSTSRVLPGKHNAVVPSVARIVPGKDPYFEVTILAAFEISSLAERVQIIPTEAPRRQGIAFSIEDGDIEDSIDLGTTPLVRDEHGAFHFADGSYALIDRLGNAEARNIETIVLNRLDDKQTSGIINGVTWRLVEDAK